MLLLWKWKGGVRTRPDASSIQPGLPAPAGSIWHHVNQRSLGPCSFGFPVSTRHSDAASRWRLHQLCSSIPPPPSHTQAWPYPRSHWQIALGSLVREGCQSLPILAVWSTCWGSLGRWQLLAWESRSILAPSKWHRLGLLHLHQGRVPRAHLRAPRSASPAACPAFQQKSPSLFLVCNSVPFLYLIPGIKAGTPRVLLVTVSLP